uniref:VPS35 endosomal protein-sorting factor-like n=1 Tax=Poecilia latipinna TaxID=48699 RepID=A0A3B3TKX0_9TELE
LQNYNWRSRGRNYEAELQRCHPEGLPVEFGDYHPLKPIMVTDTKTRRGARKGSTSSSSSSSSSAPVDPLSSMLDGTDPLSMFAATETSAAAEGTGNSALGADFEPWSTKRGEILARFTTTEKLSINLCMGSDRGKAPNPGSSAVSEKVRTRLEELDDLEEGSHRELLNLSQQDYANRIEELNQSLKEAWSSDQKVKALKIVIQQVRPHHRHPRHFRCVHFLSAAAAVVELLHHVVYVCVVGRLVYDRIWTMCSDPRPLPGKSGHVSISVTLKPPTSVYFTGVLYSGSI